jgi:sec-independent protein translocase protein TatA
MVQHAGYLFLLEESMNLGGPELIIVLLILVLLFGVGRLTKIGGELGKGIREFRQGLQGSDNGEEISENDSSDSLQK